MKKRLYWTIHDINLRPSSPGVRGKIEVMYVNAFCQPKFLLRNSQIIFVHGSYLKDQIIKKGIQATKIEVIPHFDYRYLSDSFTQSDSCRFTDYILLFGHLKPYKGIDILIKQQNLQERK